MTKNIVQHIQDKYPDLTDKQEHYCQLRSQGMTKSKAATIAFDGEYSGRVGWIYEQRYEHVRERIKDLKEERAEVTGISGEEQVRKYHDIYMEALSAGKYELAMKALERIDVLCGLESAKQAVVTHKGNSLSGPSTGNPLHDVQQDLERFSGILGKSKKIAYDNNEQEEILQEENI